MNHLSKDELEERSEMDNQAAEFSLELICNETQNECDQK